ncbi:MAG: hypothetical protein QCH99_00130 [Candidatus Bathyarchaeota archaeon]|nr:hypothetical protein [Mycoplasmatota bacterium]MDG6221656.1 hypothetical protein [Candidatus Bathyarchaeum tardum]
MWKTRELSLIILFAVTAFVYQGSIGQLPLLISGIPGLGFILVIGLRIIYGTAFLIFEGRRWRYFFFILLFCLLLSFIHVFQNPFYIFANIPTLITGFIMDITFNTFYEKFQRQGQLKWLVILQMAFSSTLDIFLRNLIFPILMPPEFTSTFTSITLMLFPLILFYGIIGGYIAFKIYSRINERVIVTLKN